MKKAQAQQIFIFIIAIVIASLIFIYGYKAINDFMDRSEEVALVRFKTDIESGIRTISSDYGSVNKLELSLPSEYQKVCFIDFGFDGDKSSAGLCRPGQPDYDPIACDAWESGTRNQNVFITPQADITIKVGDMSIDGGYVCVDVLNGQAVLRLEGKGNAALVSEWQR